MEPSPAKQVGQVLLSVPYSNRSVRSVAVAAAAAVAFAPKESEREPKKDEQKRERNENLKNITTQTMQVKHSVRSATIRPGHKKHCDPKLEC